MFSINTKCIHIIANIIHKSRHKQLNLRGFCFFIQLITLLKYDGMICEVKRDD